MEAENSIRVDEVVEHLGSNEDGVRKMAAFKLQSNIGDPSFADVFIYEGGLPRLKYLTMNATGNTLAYSLTAFSRLLEVDKGWECVDQDLVKRIVELIVTHPLVNILRGAMSILVAVVSHPQSSSTKSSQQDLFGFRALRPAISAFPQFLEMLVSRLSSADHALCTNALQLINALMRDAVTNGSENEWPKFIKRIQDLGVIRAVYGLMQSSALSDLAQPLLEFQALTKVILRKWRDVTVDFEQQEHRRAVRGIYQASKAEKGQRTSDASDHDSKASSREEDKWRRLGFETNAPAKEFEDVGFLGMMDLSDYVRRNEDGFQRLILEQSTQATGKRCPIARASIAVTGIMYEHFEVDKSDLDDAKAYLALESGHNIERIFKPMILQWSKLHTAGLQAYLRLWKSTGAEVEDFGRITELVRILLEAVVGGASRAKDIHTVEEELQSYEYEKLRELQMELSELTYEDSWGAHLGQIREMLNTEALTFIKEQRIRCLLAGTWFPIPESEYRSETMHGLPDKKWRFVKLSHNRRWLHYAGFENNAKNEQPLEELTEKIDIALISSVVSNVSASSSPPSSSTSTLRLSTPRRKSQPHTRIVINGFASTSPSSTSYSHSHSHHEPSFTSSSRGKELPLLFLHPTTSTISSEWLDGLLMLLNQAPITAETHKLLKMVSGWGLKIRLLNVRFEQGDGLEEGRREAPSREGLDENYYYDIFGGA